MKWYEKNAAVVLLLIFFFPIGLFLMWKYSKWKPIAKIIVSVFIAIACVYAVLNPRPAPAPPVSAPSSTPISAPSVPDDSDSALDVGKNGSETIEDVTALIDGLNGDSSRSDYEAAQSAFDALSAKLQKKLPESLVAKLSEYNLSTLTIEQSVDSAIEKARAKKNKVVITENAGTEDTSDVIVSVYLKGTDNLTNNMIRNGMLIQANDILEQLQSRSDISRVALFWSLPLVDVYGNTKEDTVMKIQLEKDTLNKINFDNFDWNNYVDISDDYFEHPAISEK